MTMKNGTIHVHVFQSLTSTMDRKDLQNLILKACTTPTHVDRIHVVGCMEIQDLNMSEDIERVEIAEILDGNGELVTGLPGWAATFHVYVFQLHDEGPVEESTGDDETGQAMASCTQWTLPARGLDGLYDSLIYEGCIKRTLVSFATTAMLFADQGINDHLISWNRVVLLHGPPGTGKTSLARALAQRLSIRLVDRFPHTHLLEINAHSLFSKWFSESGKLVTLLFQYVQELVEDEEAMVVILIDEVESLAAARKSAMAGSEPSDAIRVVNALLTQLDALKRYRNVLIITTSNITEAIDTAFVDRADIKQYIGLPIEESRYEILRGCLSELMRVGIIKPTMDLPPYSGKSSSMGNSPVHYLFQAAQDSAGLSGRALRKLPFQTHAIYVQKPSVSLETYLIALLRCIQLELQHRKALLSA